MRDAAESGTAGPSVTEAIDTGLAEATADRGVTAVIGTHPDARGTASVTVGIGLSTEDATGGPGQALAGKGAAVDPAETGGVPSTAVSLLLGPPPETAADDAVRAGAAATGGYANPVAAGVPLGTAAGLRLRPLPEPASGDSTPDIAFRADRDPTTAVTTITWSRRTALILHAPILPPAPRPPPPEPHPSQRRGATRRAHPTTIVKECRNR